MARRVRPTPEAEALRAELLSRRGGVRWHCPPGWPNWRPGRMRLAIGFVTPLGSGSWRPRPRPAWTARARVEALALALDEARSQGRRRAHLAGIDGVFWEPSSTWSRWRRASRRHSRRRPDRRPGRGGGQRLGPRARRHSTALRRRTTSLRRSWPWTTWNPPVRFRSGFGSNGPTEGAGPQRRCRWSAGPPARPRRAGGWRPGGRF